VKRLALILGLLAACAPPKAPQGAADPVAAAEAFSKALQEGDTAAAWALLSTNTQARADALAAKVRVSAASVSVSLDGGSSRLFRAVREGAGWKLELDL